MSGIYVCIDTTEIDHDPATILSRAVDRHSLDGDLAIGDLFVTHPWGPLIEDVISVCEVLSVDPVKLSFDLADAEVLGIWQAVKDLCDGKDTFTADPDSGIDEIVDFLYSITG